MPRSSPTDQRQTFFVLGGLVLVAVILSLARTVLIPVALAILFTFILSPAVGWLERRRVRRLPAVLIVVAFALTLVVGMTWVISAQVNRFVKQMTEPEYKEQMRTKLEVFQGEPQGEGQVEGPKSFFRSAEDIWNEIKKALGWSPKKANRDPNRGDSPEVPMYVTIAETNWWRYLAEAVGPAAETLGTVVLVLVMVVFMLHQRENLRNRIVRLVGRGKIIVTTRALDDGAQRISRYLLMQLCINGSFGVVFSIGLALIGIIASIYQPKASALYSYALLWGFVTGVLRFVPYVGSGLGSILLVLFMFAMLPGWALPLVGLGYYIVLETVVAQVVEPLLFGHSTGVSPLALLLAAAFWTWLWGPVGLIMSTPLTVMLVVLGKYVPQLEFFTILLGDDPALTPDVRFYQRLLARDQEEACALVEEYAGKHSIDAVCEKILLPALLLAHKDLDRGELNEQDLHEVLEGMQEVIDDLPAAPPPPAENAVDDADPARKTVFVLGCPAANETDEAALHILAHYMQSAGHTVEVLSSHVLTSEVLERIVREKPAAVCIASIPPARTAPARYLCKRLRQQYPELKLVIARWGEEENRERVQSRLRVAGADFVAMTLQDTRAQLVPLIQLAAARPKPAETTRSR